jgi:hypothetical protein
MLHHCCDIPNLVEVSKNLPELYYRARPKVFESIAVEVSTIASGFIELIPLDM